MDSDIRLDPDRIVMQAWDLDFSHPDRVDFQKGPSQYRRALVQWKTANKGDQLVFNYEGDYPAGVKIVGEVEFSGNSQFDGAAQFKSTTKFAGPSEFASTAKFKADANFHGSIQIEPPVNGSVTITGTTELEGTLLLNADTQIAGYTELAKNVQFVVHADGPANNNANPSIPKETSGLPLVYPIYDKSNQFSGPEAVNLAEEIAYQREWMQKILKALVQLAHAVTDGAPTAGLASLGGYQPVNPQLLAAQIVSQVLRTGFRKGEEKLTWNNEKDW